MSIRISLCALAFMIWPAAPGVDAGAPLAIMVNPTYSFAPASLRVHARLEPSPDNRTLEIAADSADFYRSSLVQLDGDRAPRVVTLEFASLPAGEYEVRGTLWDGGGHERACVRKQVIVVGAYRER